MYGLCERKPIANPETTPAAASTVASASLAAGLGGFDSGVITAELVGATGGTLDVYIQWSNDGGTTWYDLVHFPQLAAAAPAVKYSAPLLRLGQQATPTVIGKNTTPVLAANTIVAGEFGDRLRALYVAGASTSAGASVTIIFHATRSNY
jgi:hypothetical protein